MRKTITATVAARTFSSLLDRLKYRAEEFVILRDGEPVARLSPVGPADLLARDLFQWLGANAAGDPEFADDVERIQRHQPMAGPGPWES